MLRPTRSATRATSSRGWLTNTPTISARRRSCAAIASASSSPHALGLSGQKIRPSAQAPSSTQRSASCMLVMPHVLTTVTPQWSHGAVAPTALGEGKHPSATLVRRARGGARGPLPELELGRLLVPAAVVGDRHLVPRLLVRDSRDQVGGRLDLLVVQAHDQVA